MTKISWKQFLLLQLPGAALVLTLVVQVIAFSLSDVPIWRNRDDEIALATLKDPAQYRILLLGDSVTSMATGRFSLGAPGEVANISTNGRIGLHGALFEVQRYLSAHPSPEHVVLAYAPLIYSTWKDLRLLRYNLWRVYNRPEEREFLRTYFPGMGDRDWLPAILDVQERVVEPFFSLLVLRHQSPRMNAGSLVANPDAPAGRAERAETLDDDVFRPVSDTTVSAATAEALSRMCSLAKEHGFRIEVAWPPLPAQLERMLTSSGALAKEEAKISAIMERGHCDFAGFTDFNKIRVYPNSSFRTDLIHLFDYGWEQRYTVDLSKYLNGLLHPKPAMSPAPAPMPQINAHAIEASGVGRNLPDPSETSPDAPVR
jgi:hypothetical protein